MVVMRHDKGGSEKASGFPAGARMRDVFVAYYGREGDFQVCLVSGSYVNLLA